MGLLTCLFGSSRRSVKRRVASHLGGVLIKAAPGHSVVVSDLGGRNTIFDVDAPYSGEPPLAFFGPRPATRIAIPFIALQDVDLHVTRRRIVGDAIRRQRMQWPMHSPLTWPERFEVIMPQLGPPSVSFGFGDFDYEFRVEPNDDPWVRELFGDAGLRRAFQEAPSMVLILAQQDDWLSWLLGPTVTPPAVLYTLDDRVNGRIEHLETSLNVMGIMMERLVAIGAASRSAPKLFEESVST